MSHHIDHMRHALSLGRRGMGHCWPNPSVGCVIVKDGRVVGRGRTQPGGRPHAEPQALAMAGAAAKGATAYVTLEPCAHYGQTPPCAQALIDAGIAQVVAPFADEDPRVSGKGFDMLRDAGVEILTGICAETAARDHAGFFLRVRDGRPWVTLKLANSFDGRIATASGDSQWITGPEARRYVHGLRARHDAVLVGAGTARTDDPALTVRGMGDDVAQPVRIVASRMLDVPLMGQLARSAQSVPVWLCHGPDAMAELRSTWKDLGARLIETPVKHGQIDAHGMLTALGQAGLTRVFCEGGGTLAAALLGADLVDELIGFSAGVVLGAEGRPAIGALGIDRLSEAPRFSLSHSHRIGADVVHHWLRRVI